MGCVYVVEEVLELLGYRSCESYWGKCEFLEDCEVVREV